MTMDIRGPTLCLFMTRNLSAEGEARKEEEEEEKEGSEK